MALFGDFFGDFSAAAVPRLGGKQFAHLTPIAIANQGASCRVAEAKTSEAVVEAHHPRRPNEIITNKLTIWGLLMMKPMFTVALSVGMALTLACSPSSDEAAEAPAASAAPNFAAIHADDAGEKIAVTMDNYEQAESDLAFYNVTKLVGMNTFFHFPTGAFDLYN